MKITYDFETFISLGVVIFRTSPETNQFEVKIYDTFGIIKLLKMK